MRENQTVFTGLLRALGVPHTAEYSDEQFRGMTFKSLFGLTHLLKDYGIESEGWKLGDLNEIRKLTPPFLAQKRDGVFVIVDDMEASPGSSAERFGETRISYDDRGTRKSVKAAELIPQLNGVVLLAYPDSKSSEPHYGSHAVTSAVNWLSGYVLLIVAIGIIAYFFVTRGIYRNLFTILVMVLDLFGLWLSYMLLQKSLGIHTATSDRVCGVLEQGGCDVITTSKASKLFGVFSWSEVGFGYFCVSLATLLVFPDLWPELALCNILCLPYTVWSISYQKFVAHHWCTLCVGVQATLWGLFVCYLCGGITARILPLHFNIIVLAGVYIVTVIGLHYLLDIFRKLPARAE